MAKEQTVISEVGRRIGHYIFDDECAPTRMMNWSIAQYASMAGALLFNNPTVKMVCLVGNLMSTYYYNVNCSEALRRIIENTSK